MRIDIGNGVRLFVDVDGVGLEPDGPAMAERPTVVLLDRLGRLVRWIRRAAPDIVAAAFERFGGPAAGSAARDFWTLGPDALAGYFEHCMPLYTAEDEDEDEDPDVLARIVMNFELMGHFQAGEQATMDLAPGLSAATCPVLVAGGEVDPVCPIEMSEEIVAALVNADVIFERIPGASHSDVGRRSAEAVRRFITA